MKMLGLRKPKILTFFTWRSLGFESPRYLTLPRRTPDLNIRKFSVENRTTLSHQLHRNETFSRNFYPKKRTTSRTKYTQTLNNFSRKFLFHSICRFCFRNVCWMVRISDIRYTFSGNVSTSTSRSEILRIFGWMQNILVMAGFGKATEKEKITFSLRAVKIDYAK